MNHFKQYYFAETSHIFFLLFLNLKTLKEVGILCEHFICIKILNNGLKNRLVKDRGFIKIVLPTIPSH